MPQKIFVQDADQLILKGQEKYLYNFLGDADGLGENINAIVATAVIISGILLI